MKTKIALILCGILGFGLGTAQASTIQHPDCAIYLPVSAQLPSWGEYKQAFIDKGYSPIEITAVPAGLKKGDLVAGLSINIHGDLEFLGKSACTYNLEIGKIANDASPYITATLYSKTIEQKTRHVLGPALGYTIHCGKAEKVFKRIPRCEMNANLNATFARNRIMERKDHVKNRYILERDIRQIEE